MHLRMQMHSSHSETHAVSQSEREFREEKNESIVRVVQICLCCCLGETVIWHRPKSERTSILVNFNGTIEKVQTIQPAYISRNEAQRNRLKSLFVA